MLRVLHLTDPHLFADPKGALRGAVTYTSLENVLAHYNASGWRADVAVVTGDIIQDDGDGGYDHFRQLLSPLGLPVYCLPGNHDVRTLMRGALSNAPFYYCDSLQRDNWLIICLDSCLSGDAGGAVAAHELQRLRRMLATTSAEHVMVCLHHPPVPMGSKWLDSVGLKNGTEFLEEICASGSVRAAIFGHVHQHYDADHRGVRVIATPSTCRQFLPGSEEFAVNDHPPAYRRISLSADGGFDTEVVWVDQEQQAGECA